MLGLHDFAFCYLSSPFTTPSFSKIVFFGFWRVLAFFDLAGRQPDNRSLPVFFLKEVSFAGSFIPLFDFLRRLVFAGGLMFFPEILLLFMPPGSTSRPFQIPLSASFPIVFAFLIG